jgi:cobalt-zinc-cadmium resistance protein CzcA
MRSALFLRAPKSERKTWGEKIIHKFENAYQPLINRLLDKRRIIMTITLVLLAGGSFLFSGMGAEFIPRMQLIIFWQT